MFTIEPDKLGTIIDIILNGEEHGPHAFVLVLCPNFLELESSSDGGVMIPTRVIANIHPAIVAKLLAAAAVKAEQDVEGDTH